MEPSHYPANANSAGSDPTIGANDTVQDSAALTSANAATHVDNDDAVPSCAVTVPVHMYMWRPVRVPRGALVHSYSSVHMLVSTRTCTFASQCPHSAPAPARSLHHREPPQPPLTTAPPQEKMWKTLREAQKKAATAEVVATEAAATSLKKLALAQLGMHNNGSVMKSLFGHYPRPDADEPKDPRKHKTESDSAPSSRNSDGDGPTQGA